jgi:lipopolysaccharide export system protein LptA
MIRNKRYKEILIGHRIEVFAILCLFGLCLANAFSISKSRKHRPNTQNERIYLVHSDELKYDMYGTVPDAQIAKGHVRFRHRGATLSCDSAYFYQQSNSMKAFGHVHFSQGDTLSLKCDRAYYDGMEQQMEARNNVVLKHRGQTLLTDSLNYDRLYGYAYFFEGGRIIDGKDKLSSDWGEYHLDTRQAVFYFKVRLRSTDRLIEGDTLYYDMRKSTAHLVGPSKITQGSSIVNTSNGYFNTKTDKAQLYGRSTIIDKQKSITGDSLYYDKKTGWAEGMGNVIYTDNENKNRLDCGYMRYNEQTGYGFATNRALVRDYSQKDTLYLHSDTMSIYTFNINTDSVYRKIHCYDHVKAYRVDMQAICDSLVFSSQDSCMTMYKDPITWNGGRQLLGEQIKVYMNDSTIRMAKVIGQALSVEKVDDKNHYNQISSKNMEAYFENGNLKMSTAIGNVKVIFYPQDDKDSTLIGLNYTETDTMKMYLTAQRQLDKIWMPKAQGTLYPMTQIPPQKYKLEEFAWFEDLRPIDKDDVFEWRGKNKGELLKQQVRHKAPLLEIESKGVKEE